MTESDVLLKLIDDKSKVRMIPGTFRGLTDDRAVVDFDGGRVPANTIGVLPAVGVDVWVAVIDGVPFMLGPTLPQPSEGTVVSASGGTATVSTVIGNVSARYDSAQLSLATNDEVFMVWGAGPFIVGVTAAAEEPDAPESTPKPKTFTKTFTAVDSGSFQVTDPQFGWRTNDVWSSSKNIGAWFYGSKIKDTIPDSATILKAEIFLPAPIRLLGTRPFGRHTAGDKPSGAVTITATSTLSGTEGWQEIPTAIIDSLKTSDGGVGFGLGGYNIWPGTKGHGNSGALRIKYRT